MTEREEWLKWRKTGIGSSDAPVLHEASEWMTRRGLYESKISEAIVEDQDNFITRLGNEMEPKARARMSALHGIVTGQHEEFLPRKLVLVDVPIMIASLDGSSTDGKIITEYKYQSKPPLETIGKELTPGQQRHVDVEDESLPVTSKEGRCRVPYNYWIQCEHQLLVSGAEVCLFGSFDGESLTVCEVFPDFQFMARHLELCVDFWINHVIARVPPKLVKQDFKTLKVKGAKAKIQAWKTAVREDNVLMQSTIEKEIFAMVKGRMLCDGVNVSQIPFEVFNG